MLQVVLRDEETKSQRDEGTKRQRDKENGVPLGVPTLQAGICGYVLNPGLRPGLICGALAGLAGPRKWYHFIGSDKMVIP